MARKQTNESHLSNMAMKAEMDHEVQMARSDLFKIAKYAVELHDMLKSVSEAEGLEGWQQSKITKAADYLGSVYHSMDYEVNVNESEQLDELGGALKRGAELGMSAAKEVGKKLSDFVKNSPATAKKVAKAADQGIKTAQLSGKASKAYKNAAALQVKIAEDPKLVKRILRKARISFDGVEELIDRAVDRGRSVPNTSGHSAEDLKILIRDTEKMIRDLEKIRNKINEEDAYRIIMAGIVGAVLVIGSVEGAKRTSSGVQEGKKRDVDGDGDIDGDDYLAAKDIAIKKAQKNANEAMLKQINKAILFQEGKIGRANMSPKAFELAEMHHKDLAALKANFERRATNEAKKKKPDADGDGVPDWADKKPGKDDNAKKKTESVEGVCEDCGNPSWKTLPEEKKKGSHGKVCWKGWRRGKGNSCHKVKGDG